MATKQPLLLSILFSYPPTWQRINSLQAWLQTQWSFMLTTNLLCHPQRATLPSTYEKPQKSLIKRQLLTTFQDKTYRRKQLSGTYIQRVVSASYKSSTTLSQTCPLFYTLHIPSLCSVMFTLMPTTGSRPVTFERLNMTVKHQPYLLTPTIADQKKSTLINIPPHFVRRATWSSFSLGSAFSNALQATFWLWYDTLAIAHYLINTVLQIPLQSKLLLGIFFPKFFVLFCFFFGGGGGAGSFLIGENGERETFQTYP